MDYFDKAKDLYNQAVKAVSKTETEKKLSEALSNANWGASTTMMREIANLTFDYQEYSVVMREVFATLSQPPRYWRQIFKALTLLEYLVKNGADRCVQEAKERIHQVRSLVGFSFYHDGGEKGAGVREKAKALVELLGDTDMIRDEREKAKALRDKYTGIGRDGFSGGSSSMGGGMYDNGSGIGRYNDDSVQSSSHDDDSKSKDKKKKKKKDKKKKKHHSDESGSDSDDDTKKNADDDDFGDFGESTFEPDFGEEGDSKPSKKKSKKKKDKSKSKSANDDDDDDLFGGAQPSSPDAFDPFSDAAAASASNDDWSGFTSAPPVQQSTMAMQTPALQQRPPSLSGSSDFDFGGFESAPPVPVQQQPSSGMGMFGSMQMPQTGRPASNSQDFFGAPSQPMQPQMQAPMGFTPQVGMQAAPGQRMGNGGSVHPPPQQQNDPWGGLVDLGNLSLNGGGKKQQSPSSQNASMLSQQQRRFSSGSNSPSSNMTGMGGAPAHHMMGGNQGMMMMGGQQPMMPQPQHQPMMMAPSHGHPQQMMGMGMGMNNPMQQQQQFQQRQPPQQQQSKNDDFDNLLF